MHGPLLVIDDDAAQLRFLRRGLEQAGYVVVTAASAREARARAADLDPGIVLLDLLLPDGDGAELCRELRAGSDRLILVLSAKRTVADRVALLDLGADDYLVKPFAFSELTAHLRALTRRVQPRRQQLFTLADLRLDLADHRAMRAGRDLALTAAEFGVLLLLLQHPGQALDEEAIAGALWGDSALATTSNRVEVIVYRLRRKLQPAGETALLQTVRGPGRGAAYVLRAPA